MMLWKGMLMLFTELLFSLKSKSYHNIDWFWANHLRGFLGMKLKRTFCIQKRTPCSKCMVQETCPYFHTYEVEEKNWRISPPDQTKLQPGDIFSFKIILWSKTLNYALHIIKVMECFKTERFEIASVKNFDKIIYENNRILSTDIQTQNIKDMPMPINSQFILHLRTPLRIKRRKKLVTSIDSNNIAEVFGMKLSDNIRVTKIFEEWIDFQRFSHRQRTAMRMGGLIGKYEISDPEGQLTQHLAYGKTLGLGKAKTFGFGDIQIQDIQVLQKGA